MSDAEAIRSAKVHRISDAIMSAISATDGDEENGAVILSSLAVVMGCFARSSDKPREAIRVAVAIMSRIVDGDLLD